MWILIDFFPDGTTAIFLELVPDGCFRFSCNSLHTWMYCPATWRDLEHASQRITLENEIPYYIQVQRLHGTSERFQTVTKPIERKKNLNAKLRNHERTTGWIVRRLFRTSLPLNEERMRAENALGTECQFNDTDFPFRRLSFHSTLPQHL